MCAARRRGCGVAGGSAWAAGGKNCTHWISRHRYAIGYREPTATIQDRATSATLKAITFLSTSAGLPGANSLVEHEVAMHSVELERIPVMFERSRHGERSSCILAG